MELKKVSTKELNNILEITLPNLHMHCCIICDIEHTGMAINKGTVTFARINGVDGLITNYHVYRGLMPHGSAHNLQKLLIHNNQEYKVELPELEIYSDENSLDYVWLPLSEIKGFNSHSVLFFDSNVFQKTMNQLLEVYDGLSPEKASAHIGVLILNGTPNYGNEDDGLEQRIYLTPLVPSMRRFEITDFSNQAPQIILQFDASKFSIADAELQETFSQKLINDSDGGQFGGYSGGPLCAVGTKEFRLIGIIKQCTKYDSLYVIVASPITSICNDIASKM